MPIFDDDDLEGDVLLILRSCKHSAWMDATNIGLEAGFDRRNAATSVRGILRRLIKQGIVEEERSQKPIIYRMKP